MIQVVVSSQKKASDEISCIHSRQPVLLSYDEINLWLRRECMVFTKKKKINSS